MRYPSETFRLGFENNYWHPCKLENEMLTLKQLLEPNQNQNKTKNISKTIVFDKLWVNRDRFGIKKTCKERGQNLFCQNKRP